MATSTPISAASQLKDFVLSSNEDDLLSNSNPAILSLDVSKGVAGRTLYAVDDGKNSLADLALKDSVVAGQTYTAWEATSGGNLNRPGYRGGQLV